MNHQHHSSTVQKTRVPPSLKDTRIDVSIAKYAASLTETIPLSKMVDENNKKTVLCTPASDMLNPIDKSIKYYADSLTTPTTIITVSEFDLRLEKLIEVAQIPAEQHQRLRDAVRECFVRAKAAATEPETPPSLLLTTGDETTSSSAPQPRLKWRQDRREGEAAPEPSRPASLLSPDAREPDGLHHHPVNLHEKNSPLPPMPKSKFKDSKWSGKNHGIIKFFREGEWADLFKDGYVFTMSMIKSIDYDAWKGLSNYARTGKVPDDILIVTDVQLNENLNRGQALVRAAPIGFKHY